MLLPLVGEHILLSQFTSRLKAYTNQPITYEDLNQLIGSGELKLYFKMHPHSVIEYPTGKTEYHPKVVGLNTAIDTNFLMNTITVNVKDRVFKDQSDQETITRLGEFNLLPNIEHEIASIEPFDLDSQDDFSVFKILMISLNGESLPVRLRDGDILKPYHGTSECAYLKVDEVKGFEQKHGIKNQIIDTATDQPTSALIHGIDQSIFFDEEITLDRLVKRWRKPVRDIIDTLINYKNIKFRIFSEWSTGDAISGYIGLVAACPISNPQLFRLNGDDVKLFEQTYLNIDHDIKEPISNISLEDKTKTINPQRKDVFDSWLADRDVSMVKCHTMKSVWGALNTINSELFYPVGEDAMKDFFKDYCGFIFNPGRRSKNLPPL